MSLALAVALLSLAAEPEAPAAGSAIAPQGRGFVVETSAVGGAAVLRAKDHVDVVAVFPVDADPKRMTSVTLLQNVIVMSNASGATGEPRQLTLLVTPEEAQLLALAKVTGHLFTTLRNPTDQGAIANPTALGTSQVLAGTTKKK